MSLNILQDQFGHHLLVYQLLYCLCQAVVEAAAELGQDGRPVVVAVVEFYKLPLLWLLVLYIQLQ
jgi:hypothetical protein